jgi:hypothetical protein
MHRSGTSWLTGSLQHLGLELGDVNTQAKHNAKGNRENDEIRLLHESVLNRNGGDWRHPTWPNEWSRSARRKLSRHIDAMSRSHELWGFKDPRALLVLDEWHRQVDDLIRVGIYRHPLAVFRSLNARTGDFTVDEAVGLWRTYNTRLLEEYRRDPFPIMRFDVDPALLPAKLVTMAGSVGLDGTDAHAFFDDKLVHNAEAAAEPIPDAAADVWAELENASLGAEA